MDCGFAIIVVGGNRKVRGEQERPICIKEVKSSSASQAVENLNRQVEVDATMYAETVVGMLEEEVQQLVLNPDISTPIDEVVKKKDCVRVNSKVLQKAADKVKKYLKEEGNSIKALFNYEGFIPFLLKCLEDESNNTSLQFSAAWIMGEILTKGSMGLMRAIIDPDTLAVPLMVKLLHSSDRTIYEKAASVIALLAKEAPAREQLIANRTSPSLLGRLATLLKGKKPSQQFVNNVADIITELVLDITTIRKRYEMSRKGANETFKLRKISDGVFGLVIDAMYWHPPPRLTKLAIPVISALLALDNITDEIRRRMMECLATATTVLENIQPLIDNDCCTKIVSVFNKTNPPEGELLCAVSCIGNIAVSGSDSLLAFLKSLKNTGGLENYWKGVRIGDEDPKDMLANPVAQFLNELADLIHNDLNGEGINTTIDTGIIDSLVHFIEDSETPGEAIHSSISMLQCMLSQLPPERRDVVGHCLVPVLGHLFGHQQCELGTRCLRILGKLIEENPTRRNEAMSYGALSTLLDILGKLDIFEFEKAKLILKCVRSMVSVAPKVAREFFEEVPKAIKTFFKNAEISPTSNLEIALEILIEISANYGIYGATFVVDAELIPDLISMASTCELKSSGLGKMELNSITVLSNICQNGSPEHRKELVAAGILDVFEMVLESDCVIKRKLALTCLDIFLNKEKTKLSGQERVEIKKLAPLVQTKMNVNALGTLILSKTVYAKMMKVKNLK